ncbi:MAG: DUF4358 domain-containing protein [Lachnospiraceae bacterium]|nr:DUF4358 domain-containing protein [Lachnospiraceae bacterium]
MSKKGIRVILTAAVLMTVMCFSGCGKDKAETDGTGTSENGAAQAEQVSTAEETSENEGNAKTVDITSIAERLLNDITYEDELSEVDLETAGMFLSFGEASIENAAIYESSGATAEEIIALQCASEADAKKAEEALKQRVEEQKEAFEDYVPKELTKLSEAVIVTKGTVVVLSVSDSPSEAKAILEELM